MLSTWLLWIDYFRERDTTVCLSKEKRYCCGLITLGNEIQQTANAVGELLVVD